MPRIVLAYSGGPASTAALAWLKAHHDADVVTVTLDLGQGRELDDIRQRALALGAARAHVIDAREEFATRFVLPALRAGAVFDGQVPLAAALGRALVAQHVVAVAGMEGAKAVAHGAAERTGGRALLETPARALDTSLEILVPPDYGAPPAPDANLWGRIVAVAPAGDDWPPVSDEIFGLTRRAADGPDEPARVEIDFDRGVPVRINGVEMPFSELVASLETIAGAHGVGRLDIVDDATGGDRVRRVHEAPAAVVLQAAHADLEALALSRDARLAKAHLSRAYVEIVRTGQWFSPLREAIEAFVDRLETAVTGSVYLRLFKGGLQTIGRRTTAGAGAVGATAAHPAATPMAAFTARAEA